MKPIIAKTIFGALANRHRLAILDALRDGEKSVTQIIEATGAEQSIISHNLQSLVKSDLVSVRREGTFHFYSLRAGLAASLLEHSGQWSAESSKLAVDDSERNQARFGILVRLSLIGIIFGQEDKIDFINAAGARLLGFRNSKEAVGVSMFSFVDRKTAKRHLAASRGGRAVKISAVPIRRVDGSKIFVDIQISPVPPKGSRSAVIALTDMTERVRLERLLRQSEDKYRRLFDGAPLGMVILGLDGRIVKANRSFCRLLGYSGHQLTRLRFSDITHPEHVAGDLQTLKAILGGQKQYYKVEKRFITKSGSVIWVRVNGSLVRDDDGNPMFFQSIFEDITSERGGQ